MLQSELGRLCILLPYTSIYVLHVVPHEPAEDDDEEQQRQREIQDVWQYCSERSKSVEVLYDNLDGDKMLSKVHFRYDPSVSTLGYVEANE